ncbi:MAG: Superoxide dismutase [Mn], partial [uncultured Thermomicrobiales bacterium]
GPRTSPAALRRRRVGAAHRRPDDADPPRPAPQHLRHQPQRRPRRQRRAGGYGCRVVDQEPGPGAGRQADRRPQQRRRSRQPHPVLADHGAERRRRPDRRHRGGDRPRFRLLRRPEGGRRQGRGRPLRLRLGLGRPRRRRQTRRHQHPEPGQPPDGRLRYPRPRGGCLGARLLPEVPEQAPGLPGRLVEHRQLGRRQRALRGCRRPV